MPPLASRQPYGRTFRPGCSRRHWPWPTQSRPYTCPGRRQQYWQYRTKAAGSGKRTPLAVQRRRSDHPTIVSGDGRARAPCVIQLWQTMSMQERTRYTVDSRPGESHSLLILITAAELLCLVYYVFVGPWRTCAGTHSERIHRKRVCSYSFCTGGSACTTRRLPRGSIGCPAGTLQRAADRPGLQ